MNGWAFLFLSFSRAATRASRTWRLRRRRVGRLGLSRLSRAPQGPGFGVLLGATLCASCCGLCSSQLGSFVSPAAAPRPLGWLHSRQDSFFRRPSLCLFLLLQPFFLSPFFCLPCHPCCLHGGVLTVCCFFLFCVFHLVSSALAVGASRAGCTGFRSSQACSSGSHAWTPSLETPRACASVGASRCASPLPLSDFAVSGLRPARVVLPELHRSLVAEGLAPMETSCSQVPKPWRMTGTDAQRHAEAFTQKSLHRGAFTRRSLLHSESFDAEKYLRRRGLYTEEPLHKPAFADRRVYTQKLFTHRNFDTERLLQSFAQRSFYTQKLLHRGSFPHRRIYTQKLWHGNVMTQRSFYTQKSLHTGAFTHRLFYTLHRAFTLNFVGKGLRLRF